MFVGCCVGHTGGPPELELLELLVVPLLELLVDGVPLELLVDVVPLLELVVVSPLLELLVDVKPPAPLLLLLVDVKPPTPLLLLVDVKPPTPLLLLLVAATPPTPVLAASVVKPPTPELLVVPVPPTPLDATEPPAALSPPDPPGLWRTVVPHAATRPNPRHATILMRCISPPKQDGRSTARHSKHQAYRSRRERTSLGRAHGAGGCSRPTVAPAPRRGARTTVPCGASCPGLTASRAATTDSRRVALIVQKFGGTSVGSIDRIKNVAARALAAQAAGNSVVVIVSAMAGETNRLLKLAADLTPLADGREVDALAATGEQVTAALTAIAVQAQGGKAKSFLGHQLKVLTDSAFTKARIKAIDPHKLTEVLADGTIAIVAGFQGVDEQGNITTLGRGGSDTSAVAVAAAIGASACEIFTDVDGVYTTDPNICKTARKIERISYEEMLELASLGAKVLQIRSVEVAMKYGVPVHVRSSFSDAPGTWVVGEDSSFESVTVTGVAYDKGEARVMLAGVDDTPGVVASVFGALATENIGVDMIIQGASSAPGQSDVTFTVAKSDLAKAKLAMGTIAETAHAEGVRYDEDIAKVSIVGLGMRSHAGVAARMFRILADERINIQAISTSEIKVSCLVATKYTELAVRALHDGFGLGDKA
jgi:aspartate kinase